MMIVSGCGEDENVRPTREEIDKVYGLAESQSPVLFHVSFDKKESEPKWPLAEYARSGNKKWLNKGGLFVDPEGKFGQAAGWKPNNGPSWVCSRNCVNGFYYIGKRPSNLIAN
jgi:hypothetical protein